MLAVARWHANALVEDLAAWSRLDPEVAARATTVVEDMGTSFADVYKKRANALFPLLRVKSRRDSEKADKILLMTSLSDDAAALLTDFEAWSKAFGDMAASPQQALAELLKQEKEQTPKWVLHGKDWKKWYKPGCDAKTLQDIIDGIEQELNRYL